MTQDRGFHREGRVIVKQGSNQKQAALCSGGIAAGRLAGGGMDAVFLTINL